MKRIAYLLALGCASTLAHAETPEQYHYGMHLDVAKVPCRKAAKLAKPAWSTWTPRVNSTR